MKSSNISYNFTYVLFKGPTDNKSVFSSGNGLVPNRRQTIVESVLTTDPISRHNKFVLLSILSKIVQSGQFMKISLDEIPETPLHRIHISIAKYVIYNFKCVFNK